MNYSAQDIKQGNYLKAKAEETASSFGTLDGATESADGKQRMAGDRMAQLMDPNEQRRLQDWEYRFGRSNQGMEFNQAKMMMAAPSPNQQSGEQQ